MITKALKRIMAGLVWVNTANNPARGGEGCGFKTDEELSTYIGTLLPGWDSALGIPTLIELDDKGKELALAAQKAEWERRRSEDTGFLYHVAGTKMRVPSSVALRAWEELYTKAGKLIQPVYQLCLCFHRFLALPGVIAVRIMNDMPLDYEIEAKVVEASPEELLDANLRENWMKDTAFKRMSVRDLLMWGKARIKGQNVKEADVFRALGGKDVQGARGNAQYVFSFWNLAFARPHLEIEEKMRSNSITLPPIGTGKESMRKLLTQGAPDSEILALFEKGEKPVEDKSMPKKDMDELSSRHPENELLVRLVHGIRKNTPTVFTMNADGNLLSKEEVRLLNNANSCVYVKGDIRDKFLADVDAQRAKAKANAEAKVNTKIETIEIETIEVEIKPDNVAQTETLPGVVKAKNKNTDTKGDAIA